MHIEPPEGRLHTLKEFGRHYAMIVLSILTALGLEAAIETWHYHHAAEAATHEIAQELGANLHDLRQAIARNERHRVELHRIYSQLVDAITQGRPAEEVRAKIVAPAMDELRIGFEFPSLQREAWERAVANQSAAHIAAERLGKFSAAYTAQRDIPPLAYQGMTMLLDGSRMEDVLTDARIGRVDPVALLHVVRQNEAATGAVMGNLGELEEALAAALGQKPQGLPKATPPATSPAASR
jgi:hypothetical protein